MSDFGVQSLSVGMMKSAIFEINPNVFIIDLMHGLPDFELSTAARTIETAATLKPGIHVCVVDPGVGTGRKAIIIKTKRGDYLIGPDNGSLIPAAALMGGIEEVVEISNNKFMRNPISPVFHGRDIFAPAAAHLSKYVALSFFGERVNPLTLVERPYPEAFVRGKEINCEVISLNKFGSLHLNIHHDEWDKLGLTIGDRISFKSGKINISIPYVKTFGDVDLGMPIIFKDEYCRLELSLNKSNFARRYGIKTGDKVLISKI